MLAVGHPYASHAWSRDWQGGWGSQGAHADYAPRREEPNGNVHAEPLDQLYSGPLHRIIHVDVGLLRRDGAMPCKLCQDADADPLARERGEEAAMS